MGLVRAVGRGMAAGAVGTTALNGATYLDMVLRARPPSEVPDKAVDTLAESVGQPIPGDEDARDNRRQALGALLGICTGVSVGVGAGLLAPLLTRLPLPMAGLLVGAGAMVASDLPMAALGLSDPKSWSAPDWAADAAPHATYGLATVATLRALRR